LFDNSWELSGKSKKDREFREEPTKAQRKTLENQRKSYFLSKKVFRILRAIVL